MKRLWQTRELSTVAILALEVLFFAWYLAPDGDRSHPFLNGPNALLILKYSSIYGIAAIGAAMVIISGGVDLSPGAVIALASVVLGGLFVEGGWSLGASVAMAIVAGLAAGVVTSALVVLVGLPPFIATLGVMGITRGAAFIFTQARFFDVSGALPPGWQPFGIPLDWFAPGAMIGLAVLFQVLMVRFQWGRAIYAVGGNETAARFSGVAVGAVKTSVYVLAALLSTIAGRRPRGRAGAGQGGPGDGLRAGHHRVGGRRRRQPVGRARIGHRRRPGHADFRRAAQRAAPDPGRDVLR